MSRFRIILIVSALVCLIGIGVFVALIRPPADFPVNQAVIIKPGGFSSVADTLGDMNVVKSETLLRFFVRLSGNQTKILSGEYYFEKPIGLFGVIRTIAGGLFNAPEVTITVPEGSTLKEIARIASRKLTKFDSALFFELTKGKEGYLFPDTYSFNPDATAEQVIDIMERTFLEKIAAIREDIDQFDKPLSDVIKMASILEREARTTETRKIVAGILWKRISLGIPLQVDASFGYINGKTTKDLTLADLKIDSPYNSYVYKGLPPTPIANPGLDAILAAITPTKTNYLYFLTDNDGVMRYAATHDQHTLNKMKYLR